MLELKNHLKNTYQINEYNTHWSYASHTNEDAKTNAWLENGTSFIYRVAVLAAIDKNKCDWAYLAIGVQRFNENSEFEVLGSLHFPHGENDDMGRVLDRALKLLPTIHPAFEHGTD